MICSHKDIDTLARTVFGEARGETRLGQIAVAHAVLNRVKAESWYGDTIEAVCRKKWQFSCWNADDPNLPKLKTVDLGNKYFRSCMFAALGVVNGWFPDPTEGSRHYHAKSVSPDWAQGKKPVRVIGVHKFYNDVR